MKKIFSIMILLSLYSCDMEWKMESRHRPEIVVEGWIEAGNTANVILTLMQEFNVEKDHKEIIDLGDVPAEFAYVAISDGEEEEILRYTYDESYTPPFVYKGHKIRGESGKTYKLTVRYGGRELTSQTTIPEVIPIDNVVVERNETNDTLYSIKVQFKDSPTSRDFYKTFAMVRNTDKHHFACFMGDLSDNHLGEVLELSANRPFRHVYNGNYSPFFTAGDTVSVKLAHLPEEGHCFWTSVEDEVTFGDNLLFPSRINLKSNINGGLGIWCGYGVSEITVPIRKYIDQDLIHRRGTDAQCIFPSSYQSLKLL